MIPDILTNPKEYLRSLPPAQKRDAIKYLKAFRYRWSLVGREKQQPPPWEEEWLYWLILTGRGWGKALALDTPIITPDGWVTMGDLRIGDRVFNERWEPCNVTYTSEVQTGNICYDVVFTDGSIIKADGSHEWTTYGTYTKHGGTLTTLEIRDSLLKGESHFIYSKKNLFVQTYKIKDIVPTGSVPVRCIQVDSPNSLFLAGTSCIPTHNTRTGAEFIIQRAKMLEGPIAIVGETAFDVREVLIEGPAGILRCSPKWFRPKYEPSKRRLTWPNGVIANTFSGDEPGQLRGPQFATVWLDELAKYKYPDEVWYNVELAFRLGDPKGIITTTPRPIKVIKDLLKEPRTTCRVTRGHTRENFPNLAASFRKNIVKYEGTRLGKQELAGEVLEDVPGALWNLRLIDSNRVREVPPMDVIVVGVDPGAVTGGNETAIIVIGVADGIGYLLDDRTPLGPTGERGNPTPEVWGKAAVKAYQDYQADIVVGEANNGGDMVAYVIKQAAKNINTTVVVGKVWAKRGKRTRAEPVSMRYEQDAIKHLGTFPILEDEMCTWVPGKKSPNRMDAMVWAFTEGLKRGGSPLLIVGSAEYEEALYSEY